MASQNPFALPGLFRVSAIDGRGQGWRNDAVHFRVYSHPLLGMPLHPFVAHPFRDFGIEELDIDWTTRESRRVGGGIFDPSHHGVVHGRIVGRVGQRSPPEWCWISVDAESFTGFGDFRMDLLARATLGSGVDRVLATRRFEPFAFAGSELAWLRVQGHGEVKGPATGLRGRTFDISTFEGDPPLRFGMRAGPGPWYDPGPDPEGDARTRLFFGVFDRAGPPDEPDGGTGLDPDVEVARVLDELGPELVDPWVRAALDDPATPPGAAYPPDERTAANGIQHTTSMRAVDGLLTMAVDADIAHYLGFAHSVDVAEIPIRTGPNVWLVAGRWIARANRRLDELGTTLQRWIDERPVPSWLPSYLDRTFPDAASIARRVHDENLGVDPEDAWSVVTLFTAAVFAGRSVESDPGTNAAPDVPDPLTYEVRLPGRWNPGPDSAGWTQSITLTDRAAEGPLAIARIEPEGLVSLHRKNPGGRAAAILAPWSPKGDRVAGQGGVALQPRERTVTDGNVPGDHAQGDWRLWQADEWGRWSESVDASALAPPRPLPPPPELEVWFEPAERDAGAGARSPGILRLSVRTRGAEALPPGGRPVVSVTLSSGQVSASRRHDHPGR